MKLCVCMCVCVCVCVCVCACVCGHTCVFVYLYTGAVIVLRFSTGAVCLKITHCLLLLFFALVDKDVTSIQVI